MNTTEMNAAELSLQYDRELLVLIQNDLNAAKAKKA